MGIFAIDRESFKEAPNKVLATSFFLMMSFIVYIIFLNMLIPIMQASYTKASEEADMMEALDKVEAISTVLWLRDLNKEF